MNILQVEPGRRRASPTDPLDPLPSPKFGSGRKFPRLASVSCMMPTDGIARGKRLQFGG